MAHEAFRFVNIYPAALRERRSDKGGGKTQHQTVFQTDFHERAPLCRDSPSAFPAPRQYTSIARSGVRFRTTGYRYIKVKER
jgi:hypothetical protein